MNTPRHAFTRIELLATLAALAMLGLLAVPLLANTRTDAQRAGCFSNLREIGRAVLVWSGEHSEQPPWLTLVSEGGTRPDTGLKAAATWLEFLSLSNELATPRVLACPADARTKVASQWVGGDRALAHTGMRGNALSYFIRFHGPVSPSDISQPQQVISGDRDFKMNGQTGVGCGPAAVNNAVSSRISGPPTAWTNAVHFAAGHLLLADGSAEFTGDARLNALFLRPEPSDGVSVHYINAR